MSTSWNSEDRAESSVLRQPRRRPRGTPERAHTPATSRENDAKGQRWTPSAASRVPETSASTSCLAQKPSTPAPRTVKRPPERPCTWYGSARVHMRRKACDGDRDVVAAFAFARDASAPAENVSDEARVSTPSVVSTPVPETSEADERSFGDDARVQMPSPRWTRPDARAPVENETPSVADIASRVVLRWARADCPRREAALEAGPRRGRDVAAAAPRGSARTRIASTGTREADCRAVSSVRVSASGRYGTIGAPRSFVVVSQTRARAARFRGSGDERGGRCAHLAPG